MTLPIIVHAHIRNDIQKARTSFRVGTPLCSNITHYIVIDNVAVSIFSLVTVLSRRNIEIHIRSIILHPNTSTLIFRSYYYFYNEEFCEHSHLEPDYTLHFSAASPPAKNMASGTKMQIKKIDSYK